MVFQKKIFFLHNKLKRSLMQRQNENNWKEMQFIKKGTVLLFFFQGTDFLAHSYKAELETSHNVVGVRVEYEIKGRKRFDNEFSKEEKRLESDIFFFSFLSSRSSPPTTIAPQCYCYIFAFIIRGALTTCIQYIQKIPTWWEWSRWDLNAATFWDSRSVTVRAYSHSFSYFLSNLIVNVLFYYSH